MDTKVTYLGGATFLIEVGDMRLLTDPGFDPEGTEKSEGPGHDLKKVMSPPVAAEDIGPIDAVLLSHQQHYDNLDNLDNTGRAMLPQWGKVITTPESAEALGDVAESLETWEITALTNDAGQTIRITGTPAVHSETPKRVGTKENGMIFSNRCRGTLAVVAAALLTLGALSCAPTPAVVAESAPQTEASSREVKYRSVEIDGLDIFYREAGPADAPTILLLHGFPTSSHMFRELMPALADEFHMVAPDYPGFGNSSMPLVDEFDYTFDRLAEVVETLIDGLGLEKYSIYLMDYGAPVGYRIATRHPERIDTLIVQNGNAYDEGLLEFWDPIKAYWADRTSENAEPLRGLLTLDATKWQYTTGVRDLETISPDNWGHVQPLLDRPGNQEIQLALFYDYGSNPPLYPSWQEYFRTYQPPTLVVWGQNDPIFPAEGAHPYKDDLENLEFHLLDTGHFALEEDGETIAELIRQFLRANSSS